DHTENGERDPATEREPNADEYRDGADKCQRHPRHKLAVAFAGQLERLTNLRAALGRRRLVGGLGATFAGLRGGRAGRGVCLGGSRHSALRIGPAWREPRGRASRRDTTIAPAAPT